jgi:lipid-A-disaccharide synthase
MKYFIVAGEASGDLHGAHLVAALKKHQPNAQIVGWGGEKMQQSGAMILKHYKSLAFMGFWEVITHLHIIVNNLRTCKQQIATNAPDAVILIDYPGFNLRIAQYAHQINVPVYYYIAPKVWAWKANRTYIIKKYVRRLFVIFPFEVAFFQQYNYAASYVGNPLNDAIQLHTPNITFLSENNLRASLPVVALLPGSRLQEITKILPIMLHAASIMHAADAKIQFVVATAPNITADIYQKIFEKHLPFTVHTTSHTYHLLQHSTAAMVASGTATLEAALLQVPQVVCYVGNAISVAIARKLVKIPYISLVNLVAQKKVVTELIQNQCNPTALAQEMTQIIENKKLRQNILEDYAIIQKTLGNENASENTAKLIIEDLRNI